MRFPTNKLIFTSLIFALLFLYGQPEAKATHAMGVDLTYQCVGPNQYQVTLQFYRDCNGINAASTETVALNSSCGNLTVNLPQTNLVEVTPSCPGIIGTACNGGTGTYGIQKFTYSSVVTLPASCSDWVLSWNLCCRNNAITTLTSPGSNLMYVEAALDNTLSNCNNSPVFLNNPTPFVCNNQPVFYNHGAVDTDGDSLAFSLTSCYDAANTPVSYDVNQGISATNPLLTSTGVNIDPTTGALSFTPNAVQVGVLCVMVEEFRNGVKIGEVVRDIQFTVVQCSNNMPTLTGIDGTSDFSTTATVGQQLCFDVFSNDPDSGQQVLLAYNGAIPAGIFTTAGSPYPTATFCWTPTVADIGTHSFTITVSDDYCPIVGQNTYTYTINVVGGTTGNCNVSVAVTSVSDVQCSANDGSAVVIATGGTAPYSYSVINWTTGEVFTNNSGVFSNLSPGQYNVVVVDAAACQPDCSNNGFTIGGNPNPINANVSVSNPTCPPNITSNNPNSSSGSITVLASGGTAPYLYSIGSGFGSSNVFSNLAAGSYQVVTMDANGCSYVETVTITAPDPIVINISNLVDATCGQANGSVTITATGGTGGIYGYYLDGVAVNGNTISNLPAGTYTISVCDINFCIADTTITIDGTPAFTALASASSVACHGDCDGTATITLSGADPSTLTYSWSNGADGININGLCAGIYTATVADGNGCEQVVTAIVNEPDPINLSLVSSSDESCALNDGSAIITATGGTAPYSYGLANVSTGNSWNNNSGQFTALNTGLYAYQMVDANACTQECLGHFNLNLDCNTGGGLPPRSTSTLGNVLSAENQYIMVSPNPAQTIAQITYRAMDQEAVNISILNNEGKLLEQRTALHLEGSLELNISNWSAATYFIVMQNGNGEILKTAKLVVKR